MCPQVHLIVQNQNSTANKNYRKQQKFGAAKVWRNCIAFNLVAKILANFYL